ncbi:unnamed protein product [Caenorhabditis brenneri]
MSDCKQNCDKMDHKDQGMSHDFGEINKTLSQDQAKRKERTEMKGDIGGAHDHVQKQSCDSGDKCGNNVKRPIDGGY